MAVIELKKEHIQTPEERYDGTVPASPIERKADKLFHGRILLQGTEIENLAAAERFRILRAKIERHNLGKNRYHVLAVTSAVPEEGKSVVAVNLARALSLDPVGKTLLIDADMRKPSVHDFFSIPQEPGLSDILITTRGANSVIREATPTLHVITAGTMLTDPTQAIERPEFPILLDQLKHHYRYIIIDCPPTLLCPEPITISSIVESTLLVVRAWKTDRQLVEEAVSILGRSKIFGIIVNDINDASRIYDYYGYYGYRRTNEKTVPLRP